MRAPARCPRGQCLQDRNLRCPRLADVSTDKPSGSDSFHGLCHSDRLALVFEALHRGLAAQMGSSAARPGAPREGNMSPRSPPGNARGSDSIHVGGKSGSWAMASHDRPSSRRHGSSPCSSRVANVYGPRLPLVSSARVVGAVKASFLGQNVEALPVWGGLDRIAGTTLLVECKTRGQWRPDLFPPTEKVRSGPPGYDHRRSTTPHVPTAQGMMRMRRLPQSLPQPFPSHVVP